MLFGFHGRCCVDVFIAASVDQSVRPEAKLPRLCALPFEQMKLHPVAFFEAIWRWGVETVKIRIGQIFCLAGPPFESASNGDVESRSLRATAAGQTPNLDLQNVEAVQMTAQLPATSSDTKKTPKGLLHYRVFWCSATLVLFGFHSSEGTPCHHHPPSIEKTGFQPSIILVF